MRRLVGSNAAAVSRSAKESTPFGRSARPAAQDKLREGAASSTKIVLSYAVDRKAVTVSRPSAGSSLNAAAAAIAPLWRSALR